MSPAAVVRDALESRGLARGGRGRRQYPARCPAHDDRVPSLSVGQSEDGRVLLTCHAGCDVEDVVAALGLTMRDLYVNRASFRRRKRGPRARQECRLVEGRERPDDLWPSCSLVLDCAETFEFELGQSFPSRATIAAWTGLSVRQVDRAKNELRARGLIEWRYSWDHCMSGYAHNHYTLHTRRVLPFRRPLLRWLDARRDGSLRGPCLSKRTAERGKKKERRLPGRQARSYEAGYGRAPPKSAGADTDVDVDRSVEVEAERRAVLADPWWERNPVHLDEEGRLRPGWHWGSGGLGPYRVG